MVSASTQNLKPGLLPTLVLLPGMDGTGLLFERLLKSLGGGLDVVVANYSPQQPMDYAALLPVVQGILPERTPYVLLGESFSGPLAIRIAASQPANLQGLILSASFACNPRPLLRTLRFLLQRPLIAAIPQSWYAFFLLGAFATDALRGRIAQVLQLVLPEVLQARARAVLQVDERAALPRIQVPLLYLQATADRTVPPRAFAQIRQKVPHCQLEVFPAPHFLLQTVPDMAAARIQQFLRSCAKKAAACAAGSGEELRCQTSKNLD